MIADKTMFKFENNELYLSKEVNAEKSDPETNHAIEETKLDKVVADSWTEKLFYGVGN